MFEKEAKEYIKKDGTETEKMLNNITLSLTSRAAFVLKNAFKQTFKDGAEFGYNKANERHSSDEHIEKDRVVLGIIKHCNKTRYSLVQWNGEWWYQYGTYNAEVRLIAWYNIPELKESN
jgi:hypothetical protein